MPNVRTDLCLAFVHSGEMARALSKLGLPVRRLLLAAANERRRLVMDDDVLAPYRCDASFVGSSLFTELASLDVLLSAHEAGDLAEKTILWAEHILNDSTLRASFSGFGTLGGIAALPWWLKARIPRAAHMDLLSQCDGLVAWLYRRRAIAELQGIDAKISVYGDVGWIDVHDGYVGPADGGDELTNIYCASSVNLDIPRLYQRNILTMRVFDILACGGFVLTEFNASLAEVFKENEHIGTYANYSELAQRLRWWLDNPAARSDASAAGQEYVLEHHTIAKRVDEILDVVTALSWL
jgi:spore maturation protein CgeB